MVRVNRVFGTNHQYYKIIRSDHVSVFIAAFMLIGWMMTVSTGVIIARYFKPDWPETTVCGQRVWFQVGKYEMKT